MEEFHLSNGEVYVTGDRVEVQVIPGYGEWVGGVVVSRSTGDDKVPVMLDDAVYVSMGYVDNTARTAADNADRRVRAEMAVMGFGPDYIMHAR